jgi:hypothetical protein
MNQVKSTLATFLLKPGLETLHEESMEWLEEIAFWRYEVAFLYALEINKTLKSVPVKAKEVMEQAENELIKLSGEDIDTLCDEVVAHERYLGKLIEGKYEDQEEYRDKHDKIALKIKAFEKRFKILKKEIFEVVKQSKGDLLESVLGVKRSK